MSAVATLSPRQTAEPLAHIHFPEHDDWLSRAELDALTPELLVQRVRALQPMIAAHAEETERQRRPNDMVWRALRRTGVFYHFVPRRYGGLEYDIETFIDYVTLVSEACASTGWVLGQCVEHNWGIALYPQAAQDEIFGEFPYVISPGVASPPGQAVPVEGGYRVSGRWKWASGVMNADWIKANVMTAAAGEKPKPLQVVFPSREARVIDTWFMDGMCGTGSNDVAVNNLFVPGHRVLDFNAWLAGQTEGGRLHDNPIYRLPQISFLSLTTMIPAVGAAKAALAYFAGYQQGRTSYGTDHKMIDKAASQMRLGRASLLVRGADLLMRDAAVQMMSLARAGDFTGFEPRARIRAQNNQAMEMCREAVRLVCEGAGSSAHRTDNPLQRALRDINVMASHVLYDWDASTELLGRAMLGFQPNSPVW